MGKIQKLSVLNATLPSTLKDFAESVANAEFSSTSDYIRSLIKADKKRREGDGLSEILDALMKYLSSSLNNGGNASEGLSILQSKLTTISSLFELASSLRADKIKREKPDISQKELINRLNSWALTSEMSEEVPGFIEVSKSRKNRLLND